MNDYALSQLPERFQHQPRTAALEAYIARKYGAYGYKKRKAIYYNREWQPEHSRDYYRWVENVSDGLREVGDSDDIVRLRHTGWFVDNYQDETVHGVVYQLPARNGVAQYVPAVNDPNNDNCAAVDFRSVTEDKEECARWADSMAESWAEREREYQAKEDAKIRIEEIEEEIKTLYTDFRDTARAIRADCDALQGIAVVRKLVRKEWTRTKEQIHKLRAQRKRIEEHGIEYPY